MLKMPIKNKKDEHSPCQSCTIVYICDNLLVVEPMN